VAAAGGGGVLGLAAGADDLALADSAMTTLAAAVVAGGPEVRVSSSDAAYTYLPTAQCSWSVVLHSLCAPCLSAKLQT
jgi:hypothetical protein